MDKKESIFDKIKQQFKKLKFIIFGSAVIAGGVIGTGHLIDTHSAVTIDEALEEGLSPEDLGVSQETVDKLDEMQKRIDCALKTDHISDLELLEEARNSEMSTFLLDAAKEKLAPYLNEDSDNISLGRETLKNRDHYYTISIKSGIHEFDQFSTEYGDTNISENITNLIDSIAEVKDSENLARENETDKLNDRKKLLKIYENAFENLDKFLASDITIEGNTIAAEKRTKSSIKKELKQEKNDLEQYKVDTSSMNFSPHLNENSQIEASNEHEDDERI